MKCIKIDKENSRPLLIWKFVITKNYLFSLTNLFKFLKGDLETNLKRQIDIKTRTAFELITTMPHHPFFPLHYCFYSPINSVLLVIILSAGTPDPWRVHRKSHQRLCLIWHDKNHRRLCQSHPKNPIVLLCRWCISKIDRIGYFLSVKYLKLCPRCSIGMITSSMTLKDVTSEIERKVDFPIKFGASIFFQNWAIKIFAPKADQAPILTFMTFIQYVYLKKSALLKSHFFLVDFSGSFIIDLRYLNLRLLMPWRMNCSW